MKSLLEALIVALEKQAGLYRSLLNILLNEKKAVVSADLDEMAAVRNQKEAILSLIHAGEQKRMDVVRAIADRMGCPFQGLSLKLLAQQVDAPFSFRLNRCAEDISSLVQAIHMENEMNMSLITHSLNLIRASINLIVQMVTPHPVYFRTGKMHPGEICGAVLSSSV